MKNTQLATAVTNAQADVLSALLNNGYLRVYSGTQPADADTAVTDQVLLATLRFANPSAPAAEAGVISFAALTSGIAVATGVATWCRAQTADASTVVLDASVGEAADAPNLVLGNSSITLGAAVSVAELTHTVRAATSGL